MQILGGQGQLTPLTRLSRAR